MKVTPQAQAMPIQQTSHAAHAAQRAKAVAAFNAGRSSQDPAPNHSVNPNNISPEEVSAVRPPIQASQSPESTQEIDTPATLEEPKVEQPAPKVERDPALERQFQALARQERQNRAKYQQEMKAIEAAKAEIASQQASIKAKETEYSQGYISKDQLKQDTLRILADAGVSYDDLTQQIINHQPVNPQVDSTIRRLEAKIQQLEQQSKTQAESQTESQKQAYDAALRQIELDVHQEVRQNPNDYKHIAATKSSSDVKDLIEATYKEEGRVMSVEEACQEVESYLKLEYQKLKSRLEPAGQPAKVEKLAQEQQTQTSMKTLTNAAASTRKLSARERALLAFRGELKS
jgi:hypothetical protein